MKGENDDEMTKAAPDSVDKKPYQKPEDAAIEDEIIESDMELDGELVEPDNGPPQKVCFELVNVKAHYQPRYFFLNLNFDFGLLPRWEIHQLKFPRRVVMLLRCAKQRL